MPLLRIADRVVLFVHIPKTGGTSIENTLNGLGPICLHTKPDASWVPPQHWHAELHELLIPRDFYDVAFTVVRNPYARLVSEFRHRARDPKVAAVGFDKSVKDAFRRYADDATVHRNHIRPQSAFLSRDLKVFRFEDGLQPVVDWVLDFCGARRRAAIRSDKISRPVPVTISKDTLAAAAAFYQDDFRRLGYDATSVRWVEGAGVRLTG